MKAYEIFVTILFLALSAGFLWNGVKLYRKAGAETDGKLRKSARKKAILWMAPGLMFFTAALYVIFRASWLFAIVALIGILAMSWAIGSGLGENIRDHG